MLQTLRKSKKTGVVHWVKFKMGAALMQKAIDDLSVPAFTTPNKPNRNASKIEYK